MLTVLTGRSRRLWPRVAQEIGEALAAGAQRLLLLTPDQYTLQAELELMERLRLPGLLYIEVLSPSRLMTRVFSVAGSPKRVRIDARGKAMMLADVLRQCRGSLSYYGGAAGRRGFAERLAGAIGDCKRAGVTPEAVAALCESLNEGDALREKLRDIALLYAQYEERLSGAFLDGEDAQDALLARLPESGLLSGARVWIYGFDLISPQFARQIACMAEQADAVRLSLTMERAGARDGPIFQSARDTLARLARYMDARGLSFEQTHVSEPLFVASEIAHLESNLFAAGKNEFEGVPKSILLWAAANPYDEAMRTAATMRLFARNGMRFDEMAVVVGNLPDYTGAIESAFARSDILFHMARKRPALSHPLIKSWLAALRCVTLGWRTEDAFGWLKGGFCGLSRDEAERLENYAIENGLRGAKWRRPIEDMELESIRSRFTEPLLALQEGLREAEDCTQSLAAVYGLLSDVDAHSMLSAWERRLAKDGFPEAAADCAQAWRLSLETLDQLHALLPAKRLPMAGIAEIIESGFREAELGAVPQKPGTAQVGQFGHIKLGGGCKALFLLGMQDGVLTAGEASLLTDEEALRASGLAGESAAFGLRGDALQQMMQVNLLDTLAAPTERLLISHSLAGTDGGAQRPAAWLKLLKRLFPGLVERGGISLGTQKWHAPGAALDALGGTLREAAERGMPLDDEASQAAAWLLHSPETCEAAERVLRTLTRETAAQPLSHRAASALYANTRASVTQLEAFANCPFMHYIRHGLHPVPRRAFELRRNEEGTFYHRAMEGFTSAAGACAHFPEISREECDAMMDAALAPLRAEWDQKTLSENAMFRAAGEGFCRVARRAAWAYADQMRRGKFRPGMTEARFGVGEALPPIVLTLSDGSKKWLEGRIDRIDFYADAGERWLRVVDYKSGETALDPSKLYGGLQLQLMLYLLAALSGFEGVKPAGAFYSRMDDPLILTDSRDVDEIERQIAKALRLSGICVSELRAVSAMEDGSALITKEGNVNRREANPATPEELAALMRHAHALATELSCQIAAGEIAARPAQLGGFSACAWCDVKAACRFDQKAKGMRPRRLEKLTREELLERVMASAPPG